MAKQIKEYWKNSPKWARVLFWSLLIAGFGFIVASWFVPPMGIIDASVLAAFGEIQGFAGLGVGFECLFKGMDIKWSKGDTEIEISQNHGQQTN